jgi:TonB family protein
VGWSDLPAKEQLEVRPSLPEIRSMGDRPRASALWLSVAMHGVAVGLILLLQLPLRPRIVPPQNENAQVAHGRARLSFTPGVRMVFRKPVQSTRRSRPSLAIKQTPASNALSGEALQAEAQRQTANIMQSLRFRMIYGFYPGHDYQLPIRQSGEIPRIAPELLPPNYAQFVVVDITIDSAGKVADAHIVAGKVDPPIQQILLSAVREFKYIPAKRDKIPIPSQLEIVIPVPG